MGFWIYIKGLLNWQAAECAGSPRNEAAETPPDHENTPRSHADTAGRQAKPILHPFTRPTLYFAGWGFDERAGNRHYREQGKRAALMEAAGQIYVARQCGRHLLFRERGDNDERAALYLTLPLERAWTFNIATHSAQSFAEQVEQWKYGRWLLYVAETMRPGQCALLAFDPDGSGFSIDENRTEMATFRWQDAMRLTWPELLTSDPEQLRPLCADLFENQINPRSSNPYIDSASLEFIPHEFLCGSEAELRRLTVAIVQTEPGLFDTTLEPITITYRAQTPLKRAGMTRAEQGKTRITPGRVTSLCDLALRLNTFVGVEWKPRVENPNRLGHFEKQIHKVRVTVHPPSAHERAESLLILADWLEGKVREPKRLRLLGVSE